MKKNILWIEDFDTKNTKVRTRKSNQNSSEDKEDALGIFDEKYWDVIEIKKSLFEGIEYIINHKGEFDCVILDVDMSKNLQIDMDDGIWKEFFKHINIPYAPEPEGNKEDYKVGNESLTAYLGKDAGFYIVLFLISLGFPKERIIMFTAYGDSNPDNRVSEWKKKFDSASLCIPDIINKGSTFNSVHKERNKDLNKRLRELYSQEYYKSRLFLYVIYNMFVSYKGRVSQINREYAKDDKEKYKSIFNYVCKDAHKKIQLDQVEDLIENVLFYFPCMKHNGVNDLNYQALKRFSEPFEADYIGNRIEEYNTYRVMKLYRNWSAHSLFPSPENLSDELFRLLLVVGLLLLTETRFDNSNDQNEEMRIQKIENSVHEWEKELWNKIEFFFHIDAVTKEQEILNYLEEYNWKVCKEWDEIPKNMLDVYDKYGKKAKKHVQFHYLLDAFMNCFIKNGIQYEDKACRTNYALSEQTKDIYKNLFRCAYSLFVDINNTECIKSNDKNEQ